MRLPGRRELPSAPDPWPPACRRSRRRPAPPGRRAGKRRRACASPFRRPRRPGPRSPWRAGAARSPQDGLDGGGGVSEVVVGDLGLRGRRRFGGGGWGEVLRACASARPPGVRGAAGRLGALRPGSRAFWDAFAAACGIPSPHRLQSCRGRRSGPRPSARRPAALASPAAPSPPNAGSKRSNPRSRRGGARRGCRCRG
jgi:hypothetical protein